MILKFDGVLKVGVDELTVGGIDVLAAVWKAGFTKPVTVAFADATFTGDLYAYHGTPGYGEYTPGDAAEFAVGDHNIMPLLEERSGETITLWIADEPINTLDPPPVGAQWDEATRAATRDAAVH